MTTPRPDSRGDGDGWVECALGHRHWGIHGAAGLLLRRSAGDGEQVLLQHRATWSHHGGTWGLLGGARQRAESAVMAALREAGEEGGLDAAAVAVHGRFDDAHGRWSYATVLGTARPGTVAVPTGAESIDVAWVGVDQVAGMPLHPGFAHSWPVLRRALEPLTVVVDAANVVGSRPDGWWRDRPGAARRLLQRVAATARAGVADAHLPDDADRAPLSHWWPRWVVVVEGAARPAAQDAPSEVQVVAAAGSGDDAIVDTVGDLPGPSLVVTADRELRRRCAALGATVVGPGWLHGLE
jgi:8-oxo-dGTP pyrophosphatase MutT (NUDIX family)